MRTRLFRQGLSALAAPLFRLHKRLGRGVGGGRDVVSAFADDLDDSDKRAEEGRRRVQWATDVVADWCRKCLMTMYVIMSYMSHRCG